MSISDRVRIKNTHVLSDRHYRLNEVKRQMASGTAVDWAGLAAELGYADQAHFTRDFVAMVGEPPTRYAARYPNRSDRH